MLWMCIRIASPSIDLTCADEARLRQCKQRPDEKCFDPCDVPGNMETRILFRKLNTAINFNIRQNFGKLTLSTWRKAEKLKRTLLEEEVVFFYLLVICFCECKFMTCLLVEFPYDSSGLLPEWFRYGKNFCWL